MVTTNLEKKILLTNVYRVHEHPRDLVDGHNEERIAARQTLVEKIALQVNGQHAAKEEEEEQRGLDIARRATRKRGFRHFDRRLGKQHRVRADNTGQ